MAYQNPVIRIKAVVDKETNRVLFVESDGDFVDHLFSFMTLPIATIIRLIESLDVDSKPFLQKAEGEKNQPSSPLLVGCHRNLCDASNIEKNESSQCPSTMFGCMKNVYNSVKNMETCQFSTEECKVMLLFPRRGSEGLCRNLKLKIDNEEPTKYYLCWEHSDTVSFCGCCDFSSAGPTTPMIWGQPKLPDGDAVFVKKGNYVIGEGMHVYNASMDSCVSLLDIHGIKNIDARLEEREVNIGVKEVLLLLKCSLFSNTPLTDVILRKGLRARDTMYIQAKSEYPTGNEISTITTKVTLTLVVTKSNDQILYAKAKEDFVDFLFSFLTFPLGSVIKRCGGSSSIPCFDNLFNSIGCLSAYGEVAYKEWGQDHICPLLVPDHGCGKNQLLCVEEAEQYLPTDFTNSLKSNERETTQSTDFECARNEGIPVKITNPKYANQKETSLSGGYIKGPSSFLVTNDLVVTPFCYTSELFYLKKLKISVDDIEERVVTLGTKEALDILKASLVSNDALSSISSCTDFRAQTAGAKRKAVYSKSADFIAQTTEGKGEIVYSKKKGAKASRGSTLMGSILRSLKFGCLSDCQS